MFTERTGVGLDVHARSVAAAAIDGVTGELVQARLTLEHGHIRSWIQDLPGSVAVTYETGPTGLWLSRALHVDGIRCVIATPSKRQRPCRRPDQDRCPRCGASGADAAPAGDHCGDGLRCGARGRPGPDTRETPGFAAATIRTKLVRLTKRISALDAEITDNTNRIGELVAPSPAAALVEKTGIRPVTAAIVLVAWSHSERVRNEVVFAALEAVNPILVSSGNTTRHRLNRGGDRRPNRP